MKFNDAWLELEQKIGAITIEAGAASAAGAWHEQPIPAQFLEQIFGTKPGSQRVSTSGPQLSASIEHRMNMSMVEAHAAELQAQAMPGKQWPTLSETDNQLIDEVRSYQIFLLAF